jgi:hypothetical protein
MQSSGGRGLLLTFASIFAPSFVEASSLFELQAGQPVADAIGAGVADLAIAGWDETAGLAAEGVLGAGVWGAAKTGLTLPRATARGMTNDHSFLAMVNSFSKALPCNGRQISFRAAYSIGDGKDDREGGRGIMNCLRAIAVRIFRLYRTYRL